MVDETERVAVNVVRLAAPIMTSHPWPAILSPIVRAAVLVDLALSGSLTTSDDGLHVDTTQTGFAPADKLLADVTEHPDKPLAWWLHHASFSAHDLAEFLVDSGTWDRHGPLRHFRDLHPEWRTKEIQRLSVPQRGSNGDPNGAATAVLAGCLPLAELQTPVISAGREHHCGAASWLVPDLAKNLRNWQATIGAAGRDAQTSVALTYLG